jgi:tetratricopeptide (TPR) repeat protein
MGIRVFNSALIRFCLLISTVSIAAGVASAQENRNYTAFVPYSVSDINQNHVPVGDLNRALNGNTILFGGSFNQQDINRTHIPVGDLNPAASGIDQNATQPVMNEGDSQPLLHYDVQKRGEPRGTLGGVEDSKKIDAFKEDTYVHPNSAEAQFRLGLAYSEMGQNDDAIEAYKQAINIEPNFAGAHFALGLAYMDLGRYSEAIEGFNQVIRILPDDPVAYFVLGLAYAELDTYDEAIEAFKHAILINPDFAEAHFLLGLSYLNLGDKTSALDEYKILKSNNRDLADRLYNQIYR